MSEGKEVSFAAAFSLCVDYSIDSDVCLSSTARGVCES